MVRYERALSFLRLIAENQEATILSPTAAEETEFSHALGPLYHISHAFFLSYGPTPFVQLFSLEI